MAGSNFNFTLLESPISRSVLSPRLGRVSVAGRKPILTPHFVPLTSKGVVPHLTHDVVQNETSIGCLYIGLEDCKFFFFFLRRRGYL